MKSLSRRIPLVLLAALLSLCAQAATLHVNLVALNDFHGHLDATKISYTGAGNKKETGIQAGGIDTIGAALQAWRAEDPELLLVGAGDLIGASPAVSSMWADEPSIVAMNLLGLSASAVGNHEFDQGRAELLREQRGGCQSVRADKACKLDPNFGGASFPYLAANIIDTASGEPLLPAYKIVEAHGVKIALIGAVLRGAPAVVLASGVAGLRFEDEATAINRVLPKARAEGATVFVVLIHQGGHTREPFDQPGCEHLSGPIVDIVQHLDPAIRLVVSGHSHTGYLCKVAGRVVTQADMGGHVLTRIGLDIDTRSHAVRKIAVQNVVMKPGTWPADPRISAYLAQVHARSEEALARPIARVAVATVSRKANADGESPLGDLIADAYLAATRSLGAQIAFMNTGGIRKDLESGAGMTSTYGQTQIVLPFSNTVVLASLTGAQIRGLLEQQWLKPADADHSMLQVSQGFSYSWDERQPPGHRVLAGSVKLDGVPLDEQASYRVATNNFVAEGGDNYPMFVEARDKIDTNIRDLDALNDYLIARDRANAPAGGSDGGPARIVRVGSAP